MTARDTLRWGDQQPVNFTTPAVAPSGVVGLGKTNQMLQAHWRWPLSWNVYLVMSPALPTSETGTFSVVWTVIIGIGQATANLQWVYTFAPAAGLYTAQNVPLIVPAQDLQLTATVLGQPTATSARESFTIAAFAAPVTEPHAMTQLLEHVTRDGSPDEPAERWIPPGFGDQPLRHQR